MLQYNYITNILHPFPLLLRGRHHFPIFATWIICFARLLYYHAVSFVNLYFLLYLNIALLTQHMLLLVQTLSLGVEVNGRWH